MSIFGFRGEVGWALSGVFFVLPLITVIHSIFTQRDTVSRAQLLWGFGGFLALLLSFVPLYIPLFMRIAGGQTGTDALQGDRSVYNNLATPSRILGSRSSR